MGTLVIGFGVRRVCAICDFVLPVRFGPIRILLLPYFISPKIFSFLLEDLGTTGYAVGNRCTLMPREPSTDQS